MCKREGYETDSETLIKIFKEMLSKDKKEEVKTR